MFGFGFSVPGIDHGVAGVGNTDGLSEKSGLGMHPPICETDSNNHLLLSDRKSCNIDSDVERVDMKLLYRPGIAHGLNGVGKSDDFSAQNGSGMHSLISEPCSDDHFLLSEMENYNPPSDKEKMNVKILNSSNICDDFKSANPILKSRNNVSVQAPLSSSDALPSSLFVLSKTAPNDLEFFNCTSKNGNAVEESNSKPATSTHPSLSLQQAGHGLSSTYPTRIDFDPIISVDNDATMLNPTSEVSKTKGTETKSEDVTKVFDELHEKAEQNSEKLSAFILPPRKNKKVSWEDLAGGTRGLDRTGWGVTSAKSPLVTVEEPGSPGTANSAMSVTKRGCCRPTWKVSDCKSHSDDWQQELLAAAEAVTTSRIHASSSPFWRHMEPYFSFISDADIGFLNQEFDASRAVQFFLNSNDGSVVPIASQTLKKEKETKLSNKTIGLGMIQEQLLQYREAAQKGQASLPSMTVSEDRYADMNINNELLMEQQSTQFSSDTSPASQQTEEGGINEEICNLEKHRRQVSEIKLKVLNSAMEAKEIQEKAFEQCALDKLIEIAYQKYRRANSSRRKCSRRDSDKQATLAFAKWTLDQRHKFEETGKSCFGETSYMKIFYSGISCHNGSSQSIETTAHDGSIKQLPGGDKIGMESCLGEGTSRRKSKKLERKRQSREMLPGAGTADDRKRKGKGRTVEVMLRTGTGDGRKRKGKEQSGDLMPRTETADESKRKRKGKGQSGEAMPRTGIADDRKRKGKGKSGELMPRTGTGDVRKRKGKRQSREVMPRSGTANDRKRKRGDAKK